MQYLVAVQADPLSSLNFETDTSLMLAYVAQKRGHRVFFYTPENLSLGIQKGVEDPSSRVFARGHWIKFLGKLHENLYELSMEETLNLGEAHIILIRQNPPFDMAYLTTTYLLEYLESSALIVNSPRAIRDCPEKLFPLKFPDLCPPTLISQSLKEVKDFIFHHKKVVAKPLYNYGGKDIFLLEDKGKNLSLLESRLFEREPMVFQKYLSDIKKGDKRVMLINGEVVGVHLRVPQKGSFLANTLQGGIVKETTLTHREREILSILKNPLREKGLFFVGVDLVGECLIEINTTSPTGLAHNNRLKQGILEENVWDQIEEAYGRLCSNSRSKI